VLHGTNTFNDILSALDTSDFNYVGLWGYKAMKIIELEQGSEEWRQWRKDGIGASEAPVIMGVSPWDTPFRLWEKRTGKAKAQEANSAMKRGTELEPVARALYIELTKNDIKPVCVEHEAFRWLRASLDGYNAEKGLIVEIKCPGKADHDLALGGLVPAKYAHQLQHQLMATNAQLLHYVSYSPQTGSMALVEVKPDEAIQKALFKAETEFWKCICEDTAPELIEADYEQINDPILLALAEQFKLRKQQIEVLEAAQEVDRQTLITAANGGRIACDGVMVMSYSVRGNVDYKKIPELKGVDLEKYRGKPRIQTKVSIKK
jgi:putative phage-type endonuclease